MPVYSVFAVYEENHQRFATSISAASPEEAERKVQAGWPPLLIAATVEGDVRPADTFIFGDLEDET